ncbi:MFS transporter [Paraburkholderia sp. DHOC27]|uniref:MFS transporter n=1 Tax=Paraburkholderia sp. DHOC27 TaxID=2303330 RepID=UPI000E3B7547|nr:MFS transporter [Paraburkholderia sp. DHOC27]RFU46825.1 MFS transporter [Paraburkholderia sp. DHOC27]
MPRLEHNIRDARIARQALAATSMSYTLVLLDASIVNVALESIGATLGGSIAGLQWVVNAYTLSFASLLLTGGTLGDRLGARNVYTAGLALFAFASALCGFAPNLLMLCCARALQGVGSALLVPCSLSLINRAYPEPAARASAIGVWMGCGGIAMAAGPLIGGLLIHWFNWRSIFFVNIPIVLIGIVLTRSITRDGAVRSRHFDVAGQVAVAIALASLIAVLIEGASHGWRSTLIQLGAVASFTSWLAFLIIEKRQTEPMLPLGFFKSAVFSASTVVSLTSALIFYGLLFTFSIEYQTLRGESPLRTGLAFLPLTAMVALGGLCSSRVVRLCGTRGSMCAAFVLYIAGALGMLALGPGASGWLAVAPMLAIGLAAGIVSPAATAPAMSTVASERAGVAAATLNAARQGGAAVGVALFGGFISALHPFEAAMRMALITASVIAMFAALVWWIALRHARIRNDAKTKTQRQTNRQVEQA